MAVKNTERNNPDTNALPLCSSHKCMDLRMFGRPCACVCIGMYACADLHITHCILCIVFAYCASSVVYCIVHLAYCMSYMVHYTSSFLHPADCMLYSVDRICAVYSVYEMWYTVFLQSGCSPEVHGGCTQRSSNRTHNTTRTLPLHSCMPPRRGGRSAHTGPPSQHHSHGAQRSSTSRLKLSLWRKPPRTGRSWRGGPSCRELR